MGVNSSRFGEGKEELFFKKAELFFKNERIEKCKGRRSRSRSPPRVLGELERQGWISTEVLGSLSVREQEMLCEMYLHKRLDAHLHTSISQLSMDYLLSKRSHRWESNHEKAIWRAERAAEAEAEERSIAAARAAQARPMAAAASAAPAGAQSQPQQVQAQAAARAAQTSPMAAAAPAPARQPQPPQQVHAQAAAASSSSSSFNQQVHIIAPESKSVQQKEEHMMCTICLDARKNRLFLPCGHLSTCSNCSKHFLNKPCPICRTTVTSIVHAFIT